jgi:hypothetical protein
MTRTILSVVISAVLVVPALAQTRPEFAGTWTMDEKRSGSPGHEGFVGPVVWTIQHSPTQLVVERRRGDKVVPFTYEVQEKAPAAKADTTVTSPGGEAPGHRAYWDGDRLVTETLQNIQGKTVTTREVLALSPDGRELLVERVVEVEHGYTMKGAQNYNIVKDVFTKSMR